MNDFEIASDGDREIVITRTFDAPKDLVFDAFTKPEMVKQWLHGPVENSLVTCDLDLRKGGKLRYIWSFGGGNEMGLSGEYVEIERPNRIVHTELFDEDWTGGETLVTTEFSDFKKGTKVTMTLRYQSPENRDAVLKSGMAEGVSASFNRLSSLFDQQHGDADA